MPERVRIFIDFWNFQLGWNQYHERKGNLKEDSRIPWDQVLPKVLVGRANPGGRYAGTHVYASTDPNNPSDAGLNRFLHAMDGFDGYNVTNKERRSVAVGLRCGGCKSVTNKCANCGNPLKRTVEKGIDTALLTDLIRSTIDNTYDQAILITEDSDFVPAINFIQERWGKQIVHAYFRGKSDELRNACWKHIFIDDMMSDLLPAAPAGSTAPTLGTPTK
jgi:uncharacterized LabA/DUF88 family protein